MRRPSPPHGQTLPPDGAPAEAGEGRRHRASKTPVFRRVMAPDGMWPAGTTPERHCTTGAVKLHRSGPAIRTQSGLLSGHRAAECAPGGRRIFPRKAEEADYAAGRPPVARGGKPHARGSKSNPRGSKRNPRGSQIGSRIAPFQGFTLDAGGPAAPAAAAPSASRPSAPPPAEAGAAAARAARLSSLFASRSAMRLILANSLSRAASS